MAIAALALVSFLAWFLSMLAGGGSPLVLIPLVSWLFGVQAVPSAITVGMLVGNSQRSLFFWRDIDWQVTAWYLPGALAGALIGSYGLTQFQGEWLQLGLGVALLLMVLNYLVNRQVQTFAVQSWYFLPLAGLNAIASSLIGSTGPVMNPLYLNYGLEKEAMIATKSLNKSVLHIFKLAAYTLFGTLDHHALVYGLVIGLAAIPANYLGKQVLQQITTQQFRHLVFTFIAVSGVFMLWEQRSLLVLW